MGPALDPAGAGALNPASPRTASARRQDSSTEPTLQSHPITCGWNEWILRPTPHRLHELRAILVSQALFCCLVLKLIMVLLYCYTVILIVTEL